MKYHLIAARSLTYGQRMARALKDAGVTAALVRGSGENGCSYSVRIKEGDLAAAERILAGAGFGAVVIRGEKE